MSAFHQNAKLLPNMFFDYEDPRKRQARLQLVLESRIRTGHVQPWSPTIPWSEDLTIDGDSWNDWVEQFTIFNVSPTSPSVAWNTPGRWWDAEADGWPDEGADVIGVKWMRWLYYHSVLPRGEPLKTAYGQRRGEVRFTTDILIPVISEFPRDPYEVERERREHEAAVKAFGEGPLKAKLGPPRPAGGVPELTDLDTGNISLENNPSADVWMSVTPMEVFTCRPGIRKASGRVVTAGFGLGYMLREMAKKKTVKEIVVVEQSMDLINFFALHLVKEIPKVSELRQGDIFEEAEKLGPGYRYIIDIWPGYGSASGDRQIAKLRKQGFEVWAWGESAYRERW